MFPSLLRGDRRRSRLRIFGRLGVVPRRVFALFPLARMQPLLSLLQSGCAGRITLLTRFRDLKRQEYRAYIENNEDASDDVEDDEKWW